MKILSTILALAGTGLLTVSNATNQQVADYEKCSHQKYGRDILHATQEFCFGPPTFKSPSGYAFVGKVYNGCKVRIVHGNTWCKQQVVDEGVCFQRFTAICAQSKMDGSNSFVFGCQDYIIHCPGAYQGYKRELGDESEFLDVSEVYGDIKEGDPGWYGEDL